MDSGFCELDLSSSDSNCFSPPLNRRDNPQQNSARTPPNCARCRNHDIIVQLKGHKHYCEKAECTCDKCQLTAERQKVMAKQTAIRRREELAKERKKLVTSAQETNSKLTVHDTDRPIPETLIRRKQGLPVPGRTSAAPSVYEQENSCSSIPETSSPQPKIIKKSLDTSPVSSKNYDSSPEIHGKNDVWKSILLLLNQYKMPISTLPCLYIILSKVTNDPEKVFSYYLEAQDALKKTSPPMNEENPIWRSTSIDSHGLPWTLYYPPPNHPHPYTHAIPTPASGFYKQLPSYRHQAATPALGLSSLRYHPYHHTAAFKYLRSIDATYGWDPFTNEVTRPIGVLPTDWSYKTEELKPSSPASENSDKSSYSVDVDISPR